MKEATIQAMLILYALNYLLFLGLGKESTLLLP